MFRDESTKVMQKAHAQRGVSEASPDIFPGTRLAGIFTHINLSFNTESKPIIGTGKRRKPVDDCRNGKPKDARGETAILFHIEHYVVGLPDESRAIHELQGVRRVHSHETRDVMAVAGLADLGNLDIIDIVLRIVVTMAMYEVIRSRRNEPGSPARTHVVGGAAILSTSLNLVPSDGPRGLSQLCFSMIASK
ncbi:hypothetical protein L209DRAFT_741537 [Thermothelomyces heterothallicus CBS 203.75]